MTTIIVPITAIAAPDSHDISQSAAVLSGFASSSDSFTSRENSNTHLTMDPRPVHKTWDK